MCMCMPVVTIFKDLQTFCAQCSCSVVSDSDPLPDHISVCVCVFVLKGYLSTCG